MASFLARKLGLLAGIASGTAVAIVSIVAPASQELGYIGLSSGLITASFCVGWLASSSGPPGEDHPRG